MVRSRAFVSVGSNIDPAENIRSALRSLHRHAHIKGVSTVYLTPAEDRPDQSPYYNCVVEVETEIPALEFKFTVLKVIEGGLGRRRTGDRQEARTIDLDLILYNDVVLQTEDLELPDPQIHRRPFVAIPLRELAPDLRLPGSGVPIAAITEGLALTGMNPLEGYTKLLREELLPHERRKS